MRTLFVMILLMIAATYGCVTDDSPVQEQDSSDAVEIGDIIVEDAEELLDEGDTVPTVEEDVEN